MESEAGKLEMFFFPFVRGGHLIPMIDLARVLAAHGAKATIITAPNDANVFHKAIHRDQQSGHHINLHTLNVLPSESLNSIASADMSAPPFTDTTILRDPLENLLRDRRPDCIVIDMFHRWTADVVAGVGVPTIIFNGSGCFPRCTEDSIRRHAPHEKVGSDSEPFVLPGLPDRIELTKSQLPHFVRSPNGFSSKGEKSELNSCGLVVNSFHELEPAYVEYFKKEMGKKAWFVGPVSLCNRNVADKADRGQETSINEQSCLSWLCSKESNSVLYISFGSLARLAPAQLLEIACGLEASNHPFVWVVGKILKNKDNMKEENWLPNGFEERMIESKKGLVIKGWAPQLLILEHDAVGGFMTHCGWNSTMEGVSAGVPMITWPLSAEQFYNEKLITDVLRVGVRVGSEEWASWNMERRVSVKREKVEKAVNRLMGGGEEVAEMRRRARGWRRRPRERLKKVDRLMQMLML